MAFRRMLPLSGVAAVVIAVLVVGVFGGSTPSGGASAAKIVSFYRAHKVDEYVTAFLAAAMAPFLVAFAATLASRQSGAGEGRGSVWGRILVVGAGITGACFILAGFIHFALTDAASQDFPPAALRALNILDGDVWVAFNAGMGVMMLGAAGLLAPQTGGYRWVGRVAALLGIALFVPFADLFGILGAGLWILAISIALLRSQEETPSRVAPQPA